MGGGIEQGIKKSWSSAAYGGSMVFLSGDYCSNTEVQCGHRVASGDISDLQ